MRKDPIWRVRLAVLLVPAALLVGGCGKAASTAPSNEAGVVLDAGSEDGARADAADVEVPGAVALVGSPLIFAPTSTSFGLSVVLRRGTPSALSARIRLEEAPPPSLAPSSAWIALGAPASRAPDLAEWTAEGLEAGRRYEYEICEAGTTADAGDGRCARRVYAGSALTARPVGTEFAFSVLTDTHIEPREPLPEEDSVRVAANAANEGTLLDVAADVAAGEPDFVLNLGDIVDYHLFGFNNPPPSAAWARLGMLNYRRLLARVAGRAAHFPVIGNWDGESGCNTADEIQRARSQRLLYLPAPAATTNPEGGSPFQDYYAFVWGDALFVVLNVMSYTPTCHHLREDMGQADDWTLGAAQLAWLEQTLQHARSKWRFLFIHHAVGGASPSVANAAYGRGGGLAARVGEQAVVHDLMVRHGVQTFFYAHDHVFTDMVVDGVHYTLPGSAGAPWKFTAHETGYTSFWPDSGHARVTVSSQRVRVELVALGGAVLSSYVLE